MRMLVVFFAFVFLLSCSEDKTDSAIFEPPVIDEPKPVIEPESMKPMVQTPLELLENQLTQAQYAYLLRQIDRYCNGDISHVSVLLHLESKMPEYVHHHLEHLIPRQNRSDKSRIYVAAALANPDVNLYFDHHKVYYQFSENMIIIRFEKNDDGKITEFTSHSSYQDNSKIIVNDIREQIIQTALNKGIIEMPAILDNLVLDLAVIILDEAGNPIDPKYKDWVLDYKDAPRATDAQLKEYNLIHSPNAYDCVEE